MPKLLKEVYKTHEGARKRCAFENGIAKSEYELGDKAHHYVYRVVPDPTYVERWRVQRERPMG